MFFNLLWFAAPFRPFKKWLKNDNLAAPYIINTNKEAVIPNLVAPLTPLCGTLMCQGTLVGNHWLRVLKKPRKRWKVKTLVIIWGISWQYLYFLHENILMCFIVWSFLSKFTRQLKNLFIEQLFYFYSCINRILVNY